LVSGINFYDAHDCLLTNVFIDTIDYGGIILRSGSDNISIIGGIIKNCGTGGSGSGIYVEHNTVSDFLITNLQINDNAGSSMYINSGAERFIISNNICDGNIDINAATSGTRICSANNNICASIVTS